MEERHGSNLRSLKITEQNVVKWLVHVEEITYERLIKYLYRVKVRGNREGQSEVYLGQSIKKCTTERGRGSSDSEEGWSVT